MLHQRAGDDGKERKKKEVLSWASVKKQVFKRLGWTRNEEAASLGVLWWELLTCNRGCTKPKSSTLKWPINARNDWLRTTFEIHALWLVLIIFYLARIGRSGSPQVSSWQSKMRNSHLFQHAPGITLFAPFCKQSRCETRILETVVSLWISVVTYSQSFKSTAADWLESVLFRDEPWRMRARLLLNPVPWQGARVFFLQHCWPFSKIGKCWPAWPQLLHARCCSTYY